MLHLSQAKSRVTPRGNMKAARSANHRDLSVGGGLWACMAPAAVWAVWDEYTCAGAALLATFLSMFQVLASLLCVRSRIRQPIPLSGAGFFDLGGSALQRRGPGPALLSFSGPAAPCALFRARFGKLRAGAWPAPAYNGLPPSLPNRRRL